MSSRHAFIGIDIGTSGCRAIAIDVEGAIVAEERRPLAPANEQRRQQASLWWQTITGELLPGLLAQLEGYRVRALTVDGTSATTLLCDDRGRPCSSALMYDYQASPQAQQAIAAIAPADSPARAASSALAKLLDLLAESSPADCHHVQQQADWIYGRLCGRVGISDSNNSLKLGYDLTRECWPGWLRTLLGQQAGLLPSVVHPGTVIAPLSDLLADRLALPRRSVDIVAGTTDSIAAFLASGASRCGHAVTSLGSTLVIKILSDTPIDEPRYGIYSHRLPEGWLVGGASNCGAAILKKYFCDEQLRHLSRQIDPDHDSGLDYYPLCSPGERFPWADPDYPPRLSPRPDSDRHFLHGLLEGLARVEAAGYQRLHTLGAPLPTAILTTGGGAVNDCWQAIRERIIGIPIRQAAQTEAAYGAALLAQRPFADH